ncbi:MAG: ScyD/ScyE family protein [Acidobacteriota bacterium]
MSKISVISCGLAVVLTAGVCSVYLPTPSAAVSPAFGGVAVTTVATNLHNPRGLNFSPNGALYVAEAGADGTPTANCGVMGDGAVRCSATTSSLAKIDVATGNVTRVVTGIPSLIAPNGIATGAAGIHDVSFHGNGNTYMTIGLGGDPNNRGPYFHAAGANYGRLARTNPSGKFKLEEDLAGYEAANNPDGVVPDSNPYGVLALPGRVVIADAGGNDLIQVSSKGEISTLAVFSPIPRPFPGPPFVQAVPTSIAQGPDGDLYVGVLTGGPFTVGLASVYRVPAAGGTPIVAYSGFTNIIDIAFGRDGSLYVLEIAKNAIPNFGAGGRLVRIAPDGTQTDILNGPPLIAPGGIAEGRDGSLYVTNMSTSSTLGHVLKIEF